jgi:methionyl-tRNA formyltransferase
MLVDVLKSRRFVQPMQDVGWYASSSGPREYAEKITKQHHFVDFTTHSMTDILAAQRALGDIWCLLPNGDRLVMHSVVNLGAVDTHAKPGLYAQDDCREPLFRAACGRVGGIRESTYAGGKAGKGNSKVKKVLQAEGLLSQGSQAKL